MAFKCVQCSKQYSRKFNLHRHIKEQHKSPEERKKEGSYFTCALCDLIFKRKETLKSHLNTKHRLGKKEFCSLCNYSTADRKNLRRHMKLMHSGGSIISRIRRTIHKHMKCNLCEKRFSHSQSLRKHKVITHNVEKMDQRTKVTCPLCTFTSKKGNYLNKAMYSHFKDVHQVSINLETLEFDKMTDFESWKEKMEEETVTQFVIRSKTRNYVRYKCRRSGTYTSTGKGKRQMKIQGSCKINSYCPASISCYLKENGKLRVSFVGTHIGHQQELAHVTLSSTERNRIASKLALKVTKKEILKEIQSSVYSGELKRVHMANMQDLSNIVRDFNLSESSVRTSDEYVDYVSVGAWVNEFASQNKNSLVYYKPQSGFVEQCPNLLDSDDENFHNLLESDFVLLFMTETQIELFKKHGGDVVCVDGPHEVTSYNLSLYTVLVLDDLREGIPVAFLISNRQDETIIRLFFKQIRSKTGRKCCRVFMSNVEEVFYKAWSTEIGESEQLLYCSWLVLKAWWQNIIKMIRHDGKRQSTYEMLQTMSCESDEERLFSEIETACSEWNEDCDMKEFADYFYEYYLKDDKFKYWAYCFRVGAGVNPNTNTALENVNLILKHMYLKNKKMKDLNKTLGSLVDFLNNKLLDMIVNTTKVTSKLKVLKQRHRESLNLESVSVLSRESGEWHVRSADCSDPYLVQRAQLEPCDNCALPCLHCKSCFHQFTCSCDDYRTKYNMCKHIHMVAKCVSESEDVHEQAYDGEEDSVIVIVSEGDVDFDESVLKGTEVASEDLTIEEAKSAFLEQFHDIITKDVTNFEELQAVEKHFEPIASIIKAASSSNLDSVNINR